MTALLWAALVLWASLLFAIVSARNLIAARRLNRETDEIARMADEKLCATLIALEQLESARLHAVSALFAGRRSTPTV